MKKTLLFLLLIVVQVVGAQTKINPNSQINWPLITDTVDPASPTWPCTSLNYGAPFLNKSTNTSFVCSTSGWTKVGSNVPVAFNNIASGTNTSAVMQVGSGSQLLYTGSGIINASQYGGVGVSGTAAASYVPVASSSTVSVWRQLTGDDILPAFAISSFNCASCGTVEIGASVVNPAFTASYTSTPTTSAAITNTDGISSPTNLVSPYTSGTVTGTFTHTTQATNTFTLTAVSTTTKTATQVINWFPRVFAGPGTAGATGCTASGTSCTLITASGTLTSAGLSSSQVNQVFGPVTASGQKIYVLLIGNSHTNWVDNLTGFAFPMNTPTLISFTNQNGSSVSMYLYESTNVLTGTFSPKPTN